MRHILTIALHFVVSSLLCFVSASLFHTNLVLYRLQEIDVKIEFSDRLSMSVQDVFRLMPTYGALVMVGLALGFSFTFALRKYTPCKSFYWYTLAAGVTMLTIIVAMHPVLGASLLAGARSLLGISLQVLAGLIGGFCFSRLRIKYSQKHRLFY